MTEHIFNEQDRLQIQQRGLTEEQVLAQLERFRQGFPHPELVRPCTVGDGIVQLPEGKHQELMDRYDAAAAQGRAMKFTPASGAATRMFRSLTRALHQYEHLFAPEARLSEEEQEIVAEVEKFVQNLPRFAFAEDLQSALAQAGYSLSTLLATRNYRPILEALLLESGLGYGQLPKALIKFHRYPDGARTALEEHLVEGLGFLPDARHVARYHFTVPVDHRQRIHQFVEKVKNRYERGVYRLEVDYSVQKPSTDIIAVDFQNRPLRDEQGRLVFRPGGHGALLENLNDLQGDLVFVKNIDNVVPDRLKPIVVRYKKLLGGYLLQIQRDVFDLLNELEKPAVSPSFLQQAMEYAGKVLQLDLPPEFPNQSPAEQKDVLFALLNRPIRVCGMVPNQGEPGGGPFWVRARDGTLTRQIVEKAQVNFEDPRQREIWESSTHFNPTDMVLGVRNYRGEPFDLMQFRDPETGFITVKYHNGQEIKAMEWPGLWNGSMAHWISVFVEVPLITFNPVKTVFDLLRAEHQNE